MNTWLAVVAVALGSFALRLLPMLLAERMEWPDVVQRLLRHAGTAALVYVAIAAAVEGSRGGVAEAVGVAAGIVVGVALTMRGHRALTVVLVGMGVAWLSTAALAWGG